MLKPYHEVVGTLTGVNTENNQLTAIFSMTKAIDLPADAFSRETLRNMIGEKIAIFNCNGNYRVRKIENRDQRLDFVNLDEILSSEEIE